MPTNHRKRRSHKLLNRTILAACLGMGLTLLLLVGFSALILNGCVEEKRSGLCLLISVFFGSGLTAAILSAADTGAIPKAFISWGSYMLVLLLCSVAGGNESRFGDMFLQTATAAAAGNISQLVTNLVKSNKSYINKSKRKRMKT